MYFNFTFKDMKNMKEEEYLWKSFCVFEFLIKNFFLIAVLFFFNFRGYFSVS